MRWAVAIYLCLTGLKRVSSLKLHRDIGVSQKTAWFTLHRIREAWALETSGMFAGPVEADETFFGGKSKNMHRKERKLGRARRTRPKSPASATGKRNRSGRPSCAAGARPRTA